MPKYALKNSNPAAAFRRSIARAVAGGVTINREGTNS